MNSTDISVKKIRQIWTGGDGVGTGSWAQVIALTCAVLAFAIFLHWTAAAFAVELWATRSAYNHGFLILPISIYLIWDRRAALSKLTPAPNLWGLGAVFAISLVWLFAHTIEIMEGEHFAIVGLFQVIVLTILGTKTTRALILPMSYLWLMVPTGTLAYPLLQKIAALLSAALLRLSNIPTYAEGYLIEVPTGAYMIAPGCAGLNFLLTALALAPLYAYFMYHGFKKRLVAVALVLGAAVLANAVRIYAIIAIGEMTNRRINIVDDHLLYGWGFFAIILILMGLIGLRFADPHEAESETADDTARGPILIRPMVVAALLTCAVLAAPPAYNSLAGEQAMTDPVTTLEATPAQGSQQ